MIETIQRIQQLATTNALVAIFVITLAHLSLPVLKRASKRGFAVFCVFAFAAAVVDAESSPRQSRNQKRGQSPNVNLICVLDQVVEVDGAGNTTIRKGILQQTRNAFDEN